MAKTKDLHRIDTINADITNIYEISLVENLEKLPF